MIALAPDVGRFAPFSALPAAIQQIPASDVGSDDARPAVAGARGAGELAWIGVFFAAGAYLLRRRDLN